MLHIQAHPNVQRKLSTQKDMVYMNNKDKVAQILADAHRQLEPNITRIIRILSDLEMESREPVKLLEVNPATSPSGILPIVFTPDPPDIPFASVVVEVTPEEFEAIQKGTLSLPNGWTLGPTLP